MEDFLWCVRFDFVVDEKRKKMDENMFT